MYTAMLRCVDRDTDSRNQKIRELVNFTPFVSTFRTKTLTLANDFAAGLKIIQTDDIVLIDFIFNTFGKENVYVNAVENDQ